MKNLIILISFLLPGGALFSQYPELIVFAKKDIMEAAKNNLAGSSSVPGYQSFRTLVYSDGVKILGRDDTTVVYINFGKSRVKDQRWVSIKDFYVSISADNLPTAAYRLDKNGNGGYVRPDDCGPVLIEGQRYSWLDADQAKLLEKNLLQLVRDIRTAVEKGRAESATKKELRQSEKQIRVGSDRLKTGYYFTKIFFLEKYESDGFMKKLENRPPDTSLVRNRTFDTATVYRWYLDKEKKYVASKTFNSLSDKSDFSLSVSYQTDTCQYRLVFWKDFSLYHLGKSYPNEETGSRYLPEEEYSPSAINYRELTKKISFRRWTGLRRTDMKLLNGIKTALMNEAKL